MRAGLPNVVPVGAMVPTDTSIGVRQVFLEMWPNGVCVILRVCIISFICHHSFLSESRRHSSFGAFLYHIHGNKKELFKLHSVASFEQDVISSSIESLKDLKLKNSPGQYYSKYIQDGFSLL